MTGLIASLLALASEVLKLINTEKTRKYIDDMVDLKTELMKEQAKGFDSDDQRIVEIYQKLKILSEAAIQELNLYNTKK